MAEAALEAHTSKDQHQHAVLVHVTTVPFSLYAFLGGQAAYMRQRGIHVHAVSSAGEYLDLFAAREGVPVHAVEMPRAITPLRDIVAIERLVSLFRRLRPDIVHAHTPKGGLLGMIAAWLAGVPVRVYHVHGFPHETASGWKRRVLRWAEMVSAHLAHRVLFVSASLKGCAERDGIGGSKGRVLHHGSINGVDAEYRFNPARYERRAIRRSLGIPEEAVVVGYVGRVVKDKGVDDLVAAWKLVRASEPRAHLLMVGGLENGCDVSDDVRAAAGNTMAGVTATGHVLDPAPYYAAMDVLAFPSYREGFGLVAIEASAMGVPVVATDIPGCRDSVADGTTGTLVPCGDVAALAKAMCAYVEDESMRRLHGYQGRERALRDFRPSDIWDEMAAQYERLLVEAGLRCSGGRPADATPARVRGQGRESRFSQ